ncbi:MAG: mono/diheme cytochrome c family protein [Saprospiraceae bacterium]|jgi:mono/diheme cytochrome c family protein
MTRMRRNYPPSILVITLGILFFTLCSCEELDFDEPQISLESYEVTEGFELSVVASEPFLEAPVTIDFDNQSRIWAIEMRGYMTNLEGINEDAPIGRITILEDKDNDGVTDHISVFLDSLVLPRAIAHVYGGLLYVEPPNLWFIEIDNDKPGQRTLVDSMYADAGNVEHQPNGLMMNIDNWIYNANSNFRYRLVNGSWVKEPTSYRGQWGISKDDFGRIYFNSNGVQLKGDHVLPNTTIRNRYFPPRTTINTKLTENQRVYPAHATSINRGYNPGVLDKDSMLINVTSACGPLVYRGGQFGEAYNQNAFVCVPEANLIKRNILQFEAAQVTAHQAWDDREFIRSTDEGFRPVNLFNGPDGSMYIVDMHRGVIQHKAYISQYLTNHLANKNMDQIIGMGRILKVKDILNIPYPILNFSKSSNAELLELLSHPNGWVRDKAQQIIIQKGDTSITRGLEYLVSKSNSSITKIHALYTLEGLGNLSFSFLQSVVLSQPSDPKTIAHSLILLEKFTDAKHIKEVHNLAQSLVDRKDGVIDLYLTIGLQSWIPLSRKTFFPIIYKISKRYPLNPRYQEAIVSSLSGHEESYLALTQNDNLIQAFLSTAISNRKEKKINPAFERVGVRQDTRTNGLMIYRKICGACHGPGGNGITDLAPPLKNSEYINGSLDRLTSVILHGMIGPVTVNDIKYNLNTVMPGLNTNLEISDQDIADIVKFTQNAFGTTPRGMDPKKVRTLRNLKPKNGSLWTEEEILKVEFK